MASGISKPSLGRAAKAAAAPVQTSAPGPAAVDRDVGVDQILPSPTNPRKKFDAVKLQELTASVAGHGVLQSILVRPAPGFRLVPGRENGQSGFFWENTQRQILFGFAPDRATVEGRPPYELVAGERRWRAAVAAGLATIPCRIRTLTDRQVLEIQVIENDQRADTTDLERAAGYQALVDAGVPIADLVNRVGKSESSVRAILRLGRLPKKLAEAVDAGEVSRSVAELVCKLPSVAMRELCAECVLAGESRLQWYLDAKKHKRLERNQGKILNVRETLDLISEDFMVELKGSPFDVKDSQLVPKAGACKTCPKLVGNNRTDFPEGRADVCTDVECYRSKLKANRVALEVNAVKRGLNLLPAKEAKQFHEYGRFRVPHEWVNLGEKCWDAANGQKTWGALLNGKAVDKVITFDDQDQPVELLPRKTAVAVLKKAGIIKKQTGSTSYSTKSASKQPKGIADHEVRNRADDLVARAIANRVIVCGAGMKSGGSLGKIAEDCLRAIAIDSIARQYTFDDQLALDRVEIVANDVEELNKKMIAWANDAPVLQLIAYIAQERAASCLRETNYSSEHDPDMIARRAFIKFAGIEPKDVLSNARKQLEAEAAAAKGAK